MVAAEADVQAAPGTGRGGHVSVQDTSVDHTEGVDDDARLEGPQCTCSFQHEIQRWAQSIKDGLQVSQCNVRRSHLGEYIEVDLVPPHPCSVQCQTNLKTTVRNGKQ